MTNEGMHHFNAVLSQPIDSLRQKVITNLLHSIILVLNSVLLYSLGNGTKLLATMEIWNSFCNKKIGDNPELHMVA